MLSLGELISIPLNITIRFFGRTLAGDGGIPRWNVPARVVATQLEERVVGFRSGRDRAESHDAPGPGDLGSFEERTRIPIPVRRADHDFERAGAPRCGRSPERMRQPVLMVGT